MNNKITKRLVLFFTSTLIIFALIVGSSFLMLFSRQSADIYKTELERRATTITEALSNYLLSEDTTRGMGHNQLQSVGFGTYLRLIDDVAMNDVWIVDKNAQTISVGKGKNQISYSALPEGAVALVAEVFAGEMSTSESFSSLLGSPSITVGAPIFSADGQVFAAVLLHAKAENLTSSAEEGIRILFISLMAALLLSLVIAVLLSKRFTKPLKRMEVTTRQLTNGDFLAQTNIVQDDEIGSLAQHIDILAQKLYAASKESEQLEQMRKDYISNISHELRTPVTVLRGSLEALCDGIVSEPEKVEVYHKEMLSESIHLERMVNDLLELSRLQNPDYIIEKSELNLPEVVEDAVRSIRHIAENNRINLVYENPVTAFPVVGDYGRLRQMFLIALDNAVKFSDQGQEVEVSIASENERCHVIIANHGMGIAREDIPHIFDRFYKSDDEKNRNGTGLGLAIAKHIADRHGISIDVVSEQGEITKFTFTFILRQLEK
ncbi:MAG: Signal transduction histidine kinase [Clostridiales bacterium 38_11]|nr:MAG: Signal transduction histidine kinase [Clostridiales bacterium 38_11]HBH12992.1 two-component sensor histidine kinase [Clostridiales bacterium]